MTVRVLLVDDDRAGLHALAEVLSDLDARLVLVESGEDALREVLKQEFAAIVLDVRLPGMDGFEVAAAIRSLERSRRTPILFVSAHSDRRSGPRDTVPPEDFLQKPLNPHTVREKVMRMLEQSRESRAPVGEVFSRKASFNGYDGELA
jgi:CheY-like chemotaxis protein